jgi:hypothetical protein
MDVRQADLVDAPKTTLWILEHHDAIDVANRRRKMVEISKLL